MIQKHWSIAKYCLFTVDLFTKSDVSVSRNLIKNQSLNFYFLEHKTGIRNLMIPSIPPNVNSGKEKNINWLLNVAQYNISRRLFDQTGVLDCSRARGAMRWASLCEFPGVGDEVQKRKDGWVCPSSTYRSSPLLRFRLTFPSPQNLNINKFIWRCF